MYKGDVTVTSSKLNASSSVFGVWSERIMKFQYK